MRTLLATALALALAGTGWAADGDRDREQHGKGGPRDRMARWLDLTPEQSAKIKGLKEAHRKSTRDLRDRRQDVMRALRHLVEDKASDGQLSAKLNDLKAAHAALQTANQKHRDEVAKILTPLQQAKFVLGMGRRGPGGMKPGRPGGGWRGEGRGGPRDDDDRHGEDDDDD